MADIQLSDRSLDPQPSFDRLSGIVRPLKRVYVSAVSRLQSLFNYGTYRMPDFERIVAMAEVEGMLSLSFRRHTEQILNAGWSLKARNTKAVNYVRDRLFEIGQRSGQPFETTVQQIVYDCVRFYNCLVYLNRNNELSPGNPLPRVGRSGVVPPIVALEVLPVPDARAKVNFKTNRIESWGFTGMSQKIDAVMPKLGVQNVLHLPIMREPGNIFGSPWIMPVLDDVQDLRATEAVINTIVQQQGAPLLHIKIASPIIHRETGQSEIDHVRFEVQRGALEGGIYVSDDRHTIESITNATNISTLQWVTQHYKSRVREGANLSDIDLGQGGTANRNTAGTLTEKGVAHCTFIAQAVEPWIEMFVIDVLSQEGGYDWNFDNDDNRVRFEFNEIDTDRRQREETHALSLWQGDAVTHDELRQRLGHDVLPESERMNLHHEIIGAAEAKREAQQQVTGANQSTSMKGKTRKDALEREAWQHYLDGCKLSGHTAELSAKDMDTEFRISDRIQRFYELNSHAAAEENLDVAVGNLVRSQAFLVGANGRACGVL